MFKPWDCISLLRKGGYVKKRRGTTEVFGRAQVIRDHEGEVQPAKAIKDQIVKWE